MRTLRSSTLPPEEAADSGFSQCRNATLAAPRVANGAFSAAKSTWWFGAAAAGAAALLAVVDPTKPGHYAYPLCPFRTITGLDCPVCGMTRSSWALLHGHVARAIGYNALWCAVMPLLAWAWVLAATGRWPTARHPFRWRHAGVAIVIIAVAFAIARNVPWQPLHALKS